MSAKSALLAMVELKASYRRNMILGFGFSAGMLMLALGVILHVAPSKISAEIKMKEVPNRGVTALLPPQRIKQKKQQHRGMTTRAPELTEMGRLVAVPDSEAPEEEIMPTQDELGAAVPEVPFDEDGFVLGYDAEEIVDRLLPDRGEFVPYDQPPVPVNTIQPLYPKLERRAGIEGDVWLEVLVDVQGKVRDVVIGAESSGDEGFRQAAMEAAYKTIWKPAISNGQPVAVWITYKVAFRLR
jgi:TonB family protein